MDWSYRDGLLEVRLEGPFDPAQTLLCGQCFRWERTPSGFAGVVRGRALELTMSDGLFMLTGAPQDEVPFFLHYFALDEDYEAIQRRLCRSKRLAACVEQAPGIRILHQEFFEVLLSFIISQNNNIPRIRGIVERLCEGLGEPIGAGQYAFPTPQAVAACSEEELAFLRAGWRAGYLLDAARRVADGRLDPAALAKLPTAAARAVLMETRGVGPKVADCVLLYGLERAEVCPMDVWMKRAMARRFPRGMPRCAQRYAGIAQQYIFDAERADADRSRADAAAVTGL